MALMRTAHVERLTHACFLVVAIVALGVLVSWWFGLGDLTLPGRVARPMARETAYLFLVIAAVASWRDAAPQAAAPRWAARAAGLGTAGHSLAYFWNFAGGDAAAIPYGAMVPFTAAVFLIIGIGIFVEALPLPKTVSEQLGATLGLLVAFSGATVLLSHTLNVPVVAGQSLAALSTGVGFFVLGVGWVLGVGARSWPALALLPRSSAAPRARLWALLATASLVVAFLAVLATLAARANYGRERALAFELVATAADAEARQISGWFSQRLGDAEVLRESALVTDALVLLVEAKADARQRRDVQEWLSSLARHYHYENLTLTDSLGRVLLTHAAAGAAPVDQRALDRVRIAAGTGVVQFVDPDWAKSQEGQPLAWVVPLGGVPAKAVLIMEADLDRTVRPALDVWFASSPSAEAMVLGRAGDRAFFLNQPRLAPGPVRPVFPTGDTMPLAVRLAASGQEGSVAAPDYRGVPVFAAVRQIAGTPWALITKVDQAEVAASANQVTLVVGVSLAASALAVILAVGLVWYRRELRTTEYIVALTNEQLKADETVRTLSTVVAQSPVSIVITDMAGTISYVNPMFTQVTGYTAEEAIGQNPRLLTSGERSPDDYRRLWETILAGEVWHGELHNKRKDGELFWEAATIAPLRDGAGRPSGFVAVKREVTGEKAAQEAHTRLQSEFAQAQKMESVGRLAGGVAHDFNNMLAVILGHAEMALESLDDASPLREHMVEILQAGQHSSDLTRQLLAFARKQKASPKVIDLNEEVTNTLKMLRRLIGENIALVWKPGEGLWSVFMDPAQVDQILANLSVNARDAITGQGTLTIETGNVTVSVEEARERPRLRPGEFVLLSIQDTGCGMPPEVLAHLFEPFFTTKAEGKGTGLGTATVYGIVTQNNGAIEVETAVGEGTTIRLYLPRAAQEETDDTHARSDVPRGTETILVVEDETALLSICTRMLEHLGYTVVGCPSAAQAMAAAEVYPGTIHALLTDVVMPGMNGRDLADAVALRHPGIRVLFMSGYTADIISQRGVLDEGVHFLPKPFSASQLAVKLRELFQ